MDWDWEEDGARQDKGALGTLRGDKFKIFLKEMNFKVLMKALLCAISPYVENLFLEKSSCVKTIVLPDFGRRHPYPNVTYTADLVKEMGKGEYGMRMGAALDGGGDRNMILVQNAFFIKPYVSLSVLASNLEHLWLRGARVAW